VITRLLYAPFLFAIMGLIQPASAASTGAANSSKSQIQNQPKTPADAQIERTIRLKLAKSKLNADHFTVSVTKGVATIEGSTGVMQHKGAMTRIAKTSGATSVRNNIRISDAAKAKAVEGLSRNRTTAQIPRAQVRSTQAPPAPIPHALVVLPDVVLK
jgi:osmotically-inducible protein OsmY